MPYVISTFPEPTMAPGFAKSRVAVATLEEACRVAADLKHSAGGGVGMVLADDTLPKTVGPLPDGTIIEVKPVTAGKLASMAGFAQYSDERPVSDVLAAFNAS